MKRKKHIPKHLKEKIHSNKKTINGNKFLKILLVIFIAIFIISGSILFNIQF